MDVVHMPIRVITTVGCLVWAEFLEGPTQRDPLRNEDHSGNDPHWSPVFSIWILGSVRNRSGVKPNLWPQNKFIYLGQSAQNANLCPAELLGQSLCQPTIYLLWHLSNLFRLSSRKICVARLVIPRMFLVIVLNDGGDLFLFLSVAILKGKNNQQRWILN